MSDELDKHLDILKERAFKLHNKILELKKSMTEKIFEFGDTFIKIKEEKLYKVLGFNSFEDYITSRDVNFERSTVYAFIRIYKTYIQKLNIPIERIYKFDWSKLQILSHHINSENVEKFLTMAENLTRSQITEELKRLKCINGDYIDAPILGEKIDIESLQHAPVNEMGVVFLFAILASKLGFLVDHIRKSFPDCIAKRKLRNNKWQQVRIEFEYRSIDFKYHKHDANRCDIIVCWEHNWEDCPSEIEIISLQEEAKRMKLFKLEFNK